MAILESSRRRPERVSEHVTTGIVESLGERVATSGARERSEIEMPFTGEILGTVPRCTPDDVRDAVRRSRTAQSAWANVPLRARAQVFLRFHDLVLARQGEILDLIQLESGKARRHALEEVLDTAIVSRYYAHRAPRLLAPRRRQGVIPFLTSAREEFVPKGVVGVIAPWNYPLTLGITDAIPALLAGNGVVIKPDSQTPFSALWACRLLDEAGLPPDLVQVVTGPGPELGPPLIDSVDFLMFTGSTATGRRLAQQAAERLIDSSMELGGKNAMIVLDDADFKRAVPGAVRAAFSNGGQLCISAERLYVEAAIHDRFVTELVSAVDDLRVRPGLDWDVDMGSLVSAQQLRSVQHHLDDAIAKGARVLAGGRPRPDLGPYFFEPTVLTGVTPDMDLYAEETFGPIVSVTKVRDADEAVERSNASRYGLNFSVWTRDTRRGREIASRLDAGTVNVNEAYAATWGSVDAPMGGMKDSGIGRRHGEHGILKYTESKTIAVQRLLPIAPVPPLGPRGFARVMTIALKALKRAPGVS
jgi:succinate-semialdehyde dehydrogenase / glutarate-semialdehyde dehydrogenase